jgi:hypothetical protein
MILVLAMLKLCDVNLVNSSIKYGAFYALSPPFISTIPRGMHLSVSKPEIQPLIPLISRSLQILQLLFLRHSIPLVSPGLVSPEIVHFC